MSKHFKVNIKTVDLARDQGKKDVLTLLGIYNHKLQDTAKVSQVGKECLF
jgi:proteasome assembly chaperone (PAC2) family protein